MNHEKMGQFIAELRKSNRMTQKDLASKLNITDKAVSKWERGRSCPDISLLSSLAEILGVTTGELLNGEKRASDPVDMEKNINHALQYADKAVKSKAKALQNLCALVFSLLLIAGAAVCAICDLAIGGSFTWSLFPICSTVFAWLVFFPVVKLGEKGLLGTMIALTLFTVPFLWVLSRLIPEAPLIFSIGSRMTLIALVFLWIVFALFKRLKTRKKTACALSLLLVIPTHLFINFALSKMISEPILDVWDLFTFALLIVGASILFALDARAKKNERTA